METLSVEQRVEICRRVFGAVKFTYDEPMGGITYPAAPSALFPTQGYRTLPEFNNYLDLGLVLETMKSRGFEAIMFYRSFEARWEILFYRPLVTEPAGQATHVNLATAAALAALEAVKDQ